MSAYSEVQTQFSDGELLIEALTDMGFAPENHIGKPNCLTGYHGDTRADVADIIIPRAQVGRLSNDIGFVRGSDGTYSAIVSEYDSTRYGRAWQKSLRSKYAEKGILRQAKKAGLRQIGTPKLVKGKLQFEFLKV